LGENVTRLQLNDCDRTISELYVSTDAVEGHIPDGYPIADIGPITPLLVFVDACKSGTYGNESAIQPLVHFMVIVALERDTVVEGRNAYYLLEHVTSDARFASALEAAGFPTEAGTIEVEETAAGRAWSVTAPSTVMDGVLVRIDDVGTVDATMDFAIVHDNDGAMVAAIVMQSSYARDSEPYPVVVSFGEGIGAQVAGISEYAGHGRQGLYVETWGLVRCEGRPRTCSDVELGLSNQPITNGG
jgi:hypothetical protein